MVRGILDEHPSCSISLTRLVLMDGMSWHAPSAHKRATDAQLAGTASWCHHHGTTARAAFYSWPGWCSPDVSRPDVSRPDVSHHDFGAAHFQVQVVQDKEEDRQQGHKYCIYGVSQEIISSSWAPQQ